MIAKLHHLLPKARAPLAGILLLCLAAGQTGLAPAEEIAAEGFDYEPGELDGQDDGAGWAGPWTAVLDLSEVVDTSAAPLEFEVPDGDIVEDDESALELIGNHDNLIHRELALPLDRDEVYIRFLFRFEGVVDDNDFIGLWLDNVALGQHQPVPSIGLKANQGNGSGPFDIFARIAANAEIYSQDIIPGETYLIVGRLFKAEPGTLKPYTGFDLWVNPAHADRDLPQATSIGISLASFSRIGVRVPTLGFDDIAWLAALRLATTWEEVVPEGSTPAVRFRRGDSNTDGAVNLTDAVFTLNRLFLSGPPSTCDDAMDSNDDGVVQLTDAVVALNYLFLSGPEPPPPGAEACGPDPTGDALDCMPYPGCP